ncbi:AAA family ATPase [Lactococcus garvieae]|uniref:AAA family ATPase n=1 Tax=Lactococcus garvieae TaxID=1363 RepID=UPI000304969C|nr:ATP-binding protein [Lactococcus garvieae]
MLEKFKVQGFKNFSEKIELNLSAGNFEFQEEAVKNNIVKTSIIYGENASGKSNLGLAILDIATHLTDADFNEKEYRPYLNLDKDLGYASFEYHFKFGKDTVQYNYKKVDYAEVSDECLYINNEVVIESTNKKKFVNLAGAETLKIDTLRRDISFIKLIKSNANLSVSDDQVNIFLKFIEFVESMLSFDSVLGHHYQGFTSGATSITSEIISMNKVKDYQTFLSDLGIDYNLFVKNVDGEDRIYVKFDSGQEINIFNVMSKGTNALTLFYNWYIQFDKGVKFVFIDEFDAYFHHKVSVNLIKKLLATKNVQVIITTHNTVNISNEILRPDCYFTLEDNKIDSFYNKTRKELRKAHNLEKMYRAGAFETNE